MTIPGQVLSQAGVGDLTHTRVSQANDWLSGDKRFALVVGAPRSGTTLLRHLLDEHPEVGCPAEASLPRLMSFLEHSWSSVADDYSDRSVDVGKRWYSEKIIEAALAPAQFYLEQCGKRIYVDKSLGTQRHLEVVESLLPEVPTILVYRHVLDVVISGLEASPWGFEAYGYDGFVSSRNFVDGLASHWHRNVADQLTWEDRHPASTHRIRYEDLVANPSESLEAVWAFLGVDPEPNVTTRAFDRSASAGWSDHKFAFTSGIHSKSVGQGRRVPVDFIGKPLQEAIDACLVELGYEPLAEYVNGADEVREAVETLTELMRRLDLVDRHDLLPFIVGSAAHGGEWYINPRQPAALAIQPGEQIIANRLLGTTADLVSGLTGEANAGALARSGRVRMQIVGAGDDHMRPAPLIAAVAIEYLAKALATG